MLSHSHNFIFVANMKTATQSIVNSLSPYAEEVDGNHYKAKELKYSKFEGASSKKQADLHKTAHDTYKYWDSYFKFAFIRNPWDHFLSLYFWIKKHNTKIMTFDKFVRDQYDKNYECLSDWNFNGLWDRISEDNICIIDHIARFENIDREWEIISEKINIPHKKLCKINTGQRDKNYRSYYTTETQKMVMELYQKDIEIFKYEF